MRMRQRSESVCEEQRGSGGGEEARGWHAQSLSSPCSIGVSDAGQPFWCAASLCFHRFRLLGRLCWHQAEETACRTYFRGKIHLLDPIRRTETNGRRHHDWHFLCNQKNKHKDDKGWRQYFNRKATGNKSYLIAILTVNSVCLVCPPPVWLPTCRAHNLGRTKGRELSSKITTEDVSMSMLVYYEFSFILSEHLVDPSLHQWWCIMIFRCFCDMVEECHESATAAQWEVA